MKLLSGPLCVLNLITQIKYRVHSLSHSGHLLNVSCNYFILLFDSILLSLFLSLRQGYQLSGGSWFIYWPCQSYLSSFMEICLFSPHSERVSSMWPISLIWYFQWQFIFCCLFSVSFPSLLIYSISIFTSLFSPYDFQIHYHKSHVSTDSNEDLKTDSCSFLLDPAEAHFQKLCCSFKSLGCYVCSLIP